jgi:hypothetical protein
MKCFQCSAKNRRIASLFSLHASLVPAWMILFCHASAGWHHKDVKATSRFRLLQGFLFNNKAIFDFGQCIINAKQHDQIFAKYTDA